MSQPFPPIALRRRHAQTIRDSSSSYKIDYVVVIKTFLNPEGHQNRISGLKVTAILLKGWILSIGEASSVEGLRSTGLPRLVLQQLQISEEKKKLSSKCQLMATKKLVKIGRVPNFHTNYGGQLWNSVISRPGRSQGLLYKQPRD